MKRVVLVITVSLLAAGILTAIAGAQPLEVTPNGNGNGHSGSVGPTASSGNSSAQLNGLKQSCESTSGNKSVADFNGPWIDPCDPEGNLVEDYVYWTDSGDDVIQRMRLTDLAVEEFISEIPYPSGIDVIQSTGDLLWSDDLDEKIFRTSADGSTTETLVTESRSSLLEIDEQAGLMFWVEAGEVNSANLDGSDHQALDSFRGYNGLGVDTVNQRVYWGESWVGVWSIAYDGTDKVQVLSIANSSVKDIAVDNVAGKIYFTDNLRNVIQRANLDGTNLETILIGEPVVGRPWGIDLDLDSGQMYWTDAPTQGQGRLLRANLDGSGIEVLLVGLGSPGGIALGPGAAIPDPASTSIMER